MNYARRSSRSHYPICAFCASGILGDAARRFTLANNSQRRERKRNARLGVATLSAPSTGCSASYNFTSTQRAIAASLHRRTTRARTNRYAFFNISRKTTLITIDKRYEYFERARFNEIKIKKKQRKLKFLIKTARVTGWLSPRSRYRATILAYLSRANVPGVIAQRLIADYDREKQRYFFYIFFTLRITIN